MGFGCLGCAPPVCPPRLPSPWPSPAERERGCAFGARCGKVCFSLDPRVRGDDGGLAGMTCEGPPLGFWFCGGDVGLEAFAGGLEGLVDVLGGVG